MEMIAFYILASIAVIAALAVILHPKVLYSAIFLIAVQLCIAICFYLLGSTVLAVFQLIIYAGAIMVLFLFIIMVIGPAPEKEEDSRLPGQGLLAFLLGLALVYGGFLLWSALRLGGVAAGAAAPEIEMLGRIILVDYVYLFELVSLLLLVAMVAAMMLVKRRAKSRGSRK